MEKAIKKPNDVMVTFADSKKVTNSGFYWFLGEKTADLRKQDRKYFNQKAGTLIYQMKPIVGLWGLPIGKKVSWIFKSVGSRVSWWNFVIWIKQKTSVWNQSDRWNQWVLNNSTERILLRLFNGHERVDAVIYVANDKTIANATYKIWLKKRYIQGRTQADIKDGHGNSQLEFRN